MKDLAQKIKDLREKRGWTQKDLAGKCGVSPRTVENWEQERTAVSGPALTILKQLFEEKIPCLSCQGTGYYYKHPTEEGTFILCSECKGKGYK